MKKDFVEPGIARCMDPAAMKDKLLLTTPASAFQCKSKYFINISRNDLGDRVETGAKRNALVQRGYSKELRMLRESRLMLRRLKFFYRNNNDEFAFDQYFVNVRVFILAHFLELHSNCSLILDFSSVQQNSSQPRSWPSATCAIRPLVRTEDSAKRYPTGNFVVSAHQDITGTGVSIKLTRAMEILAGTPELAKYWRKEDSGNYVHGDSSCK